MPVAALMFALGAAGLHAFWNLLLARADDSETATAVAFVIAILVFAPVATLTWRLDGRAWPFLAVTSVLQFVYFVVLAWAYRRADLSVVYPVARGVAPLVVLVVGVAALGAGVTGRQVAGVLLVACGVLLIRGLRVGARPADLGLGLLLSAIIASYTLVDKHGIRYASPVVYLEVSMTPAALGYAGLVLRRRGREAVVGAVGLMPSVAGCASLGAYVLVLAALQRAPAASVAAVRETSILLVALLAARFLGEPVGRARLAGAAAVVAGVAMLGVAS
jgi:drug/metabolite transporter (DMT)-like permease